MVLIGIDDTDNKHSRGTGFRARQLAALIENEKKGTVRSISRHQLFYDSRIPYTSQNSSACLSVSEGNKELLIKTAADFLIRESAPGSDAGLAVAHDEEVNESVFKWGIRAKKEVLTQVEAKATAERSDIFLEGYTGNKDGIIGALAAIGLKKGGNDGRCVWIQGEDIRELKGNYSAQTLYELLRIDQIINKEGKKIDNNSIINVGDWLRPVIIENKITVIVENSKINSDYEFKVVHKDYIKSISD